MIIDADGHFFEPLDWLEEANPRLNSCVYDQERMRGCENQ
jgi:hypothetical protein